MIASRRLKLIADTELAERSGPTIRVGIATRDMSALDAHFGSARKFAIYDVSTAGWSFVEAVAFDDVSNEEGNHKTEGDDRIGPKVQALEGCQLLFVRAIGGPAAAKVVAAHIHPIKMPADLPLDAVLEKVRTMLSGTPPPWLRKVIGTDTKPAFDDEDPS